MADRRSDWVEILEPRSRELMYINLSTGECGWEPPPDVPVRQSDGNQWWELYDRSSSRFYYYNCTNQQTVWHRPENCDVVPLAQLQAMKKSSEAELRTDVRIHKAGLSSSTQSSSLEPDSGRATPSSQGKRDSLEGRETGQRWQPAPGSKAAMLVKIDSTCKKPSPGPVSSHFKPTGISHTSRNPSKPDRSALLKKMSVPVDFKQVLPVTGNFATVLPSSAAPNKRPSSPQYGATPSAPIYDEPPTAEPPIYDEPPQEMEAEGCHRSLLPTSLAPKLLQHPNSKAICSNSEYSPAGRECIKHMVNVEAPAPKSDGGSISALCRAQTQSGRIKTEVALEKKHSWRLLEPRHSRQSSFTSQEYPSPAVVTYQDSGYSTGPSPSLRRKNRRRAPLGSGSGRPGSVGSNGELSALNEMLMAEMRSVVKRSSVLDGSKASLDTEMGSEAWESSARSPLSGSQEDVAQSSRSVFRSHGDVVLSPLVMDALSCRQKRTFEKVDSLEKIPTQTRLSSPELPRVSSQTGTLDSGQEMANQDRDRTSRITHIIPSSRPPPLLSTYQYPYHTLCKPPVDANIEDWASKNLNQHTQGLFRRRVSITNMLSWNRGSIKKPMLITSDRAVKKESCEMFKLVQAYMGDRSGRLDKRHSALQVVTKCWGTQALRDELYVQLVRQTTDNWSLSSLEAGWELMAISLAFFSPSPKFRHYLEGYIQRHLEPGQDEKLLQQIVQQQDMKSKKNSRSMKKRRQSDEDVEDLKLPISTYAKYCYRKLQKVAITGGKKGLRKPTLEEIDQGRNAIVTPSLFGSALEEIMERQNQLFPDRKLPWVQVQLSQYVLALGGARAEGIFRVPGDIDEVNALKLQVEQWRIPENLSDPNVPASLLKLWYRELEEPVIPQSFYKQCVAHYEDPDAAVAVVQDLPELNRLVLCYFIHFLQVFAQPANVSRTKMDVNNLAMVMAPNCLRCQSDDPRVIFENTRKEMSFLRILVVHLDTSFITGVM